jgi:hypothetical protein
MNQHSAICDDFRTALAPRRRISKAQSERVRGLGLAALEREREAATLIVKRFADAVAACTDKPESAHEFLQQLDLRIVTRDHDWRAIFGELAAREDVDPEHASSAIWHYLSYLCSRQDLIEFTYRNRRSLEHTAELRQRHEAEPGRKRLPKGEPVVVHIPYRGELTIYLGRHPFRIVDGYPPKLVSPTGAEVVLAHGRLLLGRHPGCDRVVGAYLSDVSRGHMYVEWNGDTRLQITDLSSQGTFVEEAGMRPAARREEPVNFRRQMVFVDQTSETCVNSRAGATG